MIRNSHVTEHSKGTGRFSHDEENLSNYMYEQEQQVLLLQPDTQIPLDTDDECSEEVTNVPCWPTNQRRRSAIYTKTEEEQCASNEDLPWQRFLRSATKESKNIMYKKPIFLLKNSEGPDLAEIFRRELVDGDELFSNGSDYGIECEETDEDVENITESFLESPKIPNKAVSEKLKDNLTMSNENTPVISSSSFNLSEESLLCSTLKDSHCESTNQTIFSANILFRNSKCSSMPISRGEILKSTNVLPMHNAFDGQIFLNSFESSRTTSGNSLNEIKNGIAVQPQYISYQGSSECNPKGSDSIIDCDFFNDLNYSFGEELGCSTTMHAAIHAPTYSPFCTQSQLSVTLSDKDNFCETARTIEHYQLKNSHCISMANKTASINEKLPFRGGTQRFSSLLSNKESCIAGFQDTSIYSKVLSYNSEIPIKGKIEKSASGMESSMPSNFKKATKMNQDIDKNTSSSASISTQNFSNSNNCLFNLNSAFDKQHKTDDGIFKNALDSRHAYTDNCNIQRNLSPAINYSRSTILCKSLVKSTCDNDDKITENSQERLNNTTVKLEDEAFFFLLGLESCNDYKTTNEIKHFRKSAFSSNCTKKNEVSQPQFNCIASKGDGIPFTAQKLIQPIKEVGECFTIRKYTGSTTVGNSTNNCVKKSSEQAQLWDNCTTTETFGLSQEEMQDFMDLEL